MATLIHEEEKKAAEICGIFAEKEILPLTGISLSHDFPFELWKKMGEERLLGLGISREYGGFGASTVGISKAASHLVRRGGNLGMVLSWMIHQLVSKFFIEQFGTEAQKKKWLPGLATGEITACFAVSEPQKGAHPKLLSTKAEKTETGYLLAGEKTYLTNGPIANLFIVVAVTGERDGKKQFTAFIVPESATGLVKNPPMQIPFFRPSPHGGITLDRCPVPEENILGTAGSAYPDMVLPFRDLEDAVMMGPVTGAMERELDLLTKIIEESDVTPGDKALQAMGKLKAMTDTAKIISFESAAIIDSGKAHSEKISLLVFFRSLAHDFGTKLEQLLADLDLKKSTELEILFNDLAASAGIASNIAKIKTVRLGKQLLKQ